MKSPKYTFCREFNSEHTYNFSRWWRHYCDVIWQQNTVDLCTIFSIRLLS